MYGSLKPEFRSLATLKLVVNFVGKLQTEKNSCSIARFPCDSTTFFFKLSLLRSNEVSHSVARECPEACKKQAGKFPVGCPFPQNYTTMLGCFKFVTTQGLQIGVG